MAEREPFTHVELDPTVSGFPPVVAHAEIKRLNAEVDRLRAENERLRAVVEAAKEYVRQALPAPHDLRLRVALARLDQRPAWKPPPANPDLMAEELHP